MSDIQAELIDIFEQLADSTLEDGSIGIDAMGTALEPEAAITDGAAEIAGTGGLDTLSAGSATAGLFSGPVNVSGAPDTGGLASAAAESGGAPGVLGTLETVGMDVLKSAFGLSPIIGGLISLFGGGGSSAPAPLVRYQMPNPVQYTGAEVDGVIEGGDFSQTGGARAYGGEIGSAAAIPGITFNVSAMDAQSFLDRSGDIAAAVKSAMLNLNSINDVVNDL